MAASRKSTQGAAVMNTYPILRRELDSLFYKMDKILLKKSTISKRSMQLLKRQAKAYGDLIKAKYQDAEVSETVNELLEMENII